MTKNVWINKISNLFAGHSHLPGPVANKLIQAANAEMQDKWQSLGIKHEAVFGYDNEGPIFDV